MTSLQAGFGKVELAGAEAGVELVGYPDREGPALGVRDPLHARALVLDAGGRRIALCSLELCYCGEDVVAAARARIAARGLAPADAVFLAVTHTHSGPHDVDPACWPDGLEAHIEAAVADACERLEPAVVGAGWGALHGHTINRRRLEDPVDPALLALRVDARDGRALGVVYAFGCHPVVLGPDNRLVSGDWPASASRTLESQLGADAVAVFLQGASGDVNPLTQGVRERLAERRTITSTTMLSYHGPEEPPFAIGDRRGGTFEEVQQLGDVVADEVLRVHRGVVPQDVTGVWTRQLMVELPAPAHAAPADDLRGHHFPRVEPGAPLEVMLVGIDGPGVVLVGQTGELFVESGVELRRALRNHGVRHPFALGCANGRRVYLPPASAYPDGGYEIDWARANGMPETLQDEILARVLEQL